MAQQTALGLKVIGTLKLVSALLLAGVGFGIFRYISLGIDVVGLIAQLHLDPEKHVIHDLLYRLTGIAPAKLRAIGAATFLYAGLYLIEGIGLLKGRRWAEYLTIIITASFLPLEGYEVIIHAGSIRIAVLLINLAIVVYLLKQLKNPAS